jgi:hypothetical protein
MNIFYQFLNVNAVNDVRQKETKALEPVDREKLKDINHYHQYFQMCLIIYAIVYKHLCATGIL